MKLFYHFANNKGLDGQLADETSLLNLRTFIRWSIIPEKLFTQICHYVVRFTRNWPLAITHL